MAPPKHTPATVQTASGASNAQNVPKKKLGLSARGRMGREIGI